MTNRNRLRSIMNIAYLNGIIPIRTQPLYLINLIAQPMAFLFTLTIASRGAYFQYGIGGGLVLTILSVGTSLQTDMSHYKQDLKLQDVLVASPVEAPVYVAGMALSELLYSLPGIGVFVGLWIAFGDPTVAGGLTLLGVLLLVWMFASALGFTLATYFEDVRETFVFSPLISLTMSVLPPVYYPISALNQYPGWVRALAELSPTTYAADLAHGASGLAAPTLSGALLDWGVLIAFTLALLGLAAAKARWREP